MKQAIASATVAMLLTATGAAAQQSPAEPAPPADEPNWRFAWEGHPSLFLGDDVRLDFRFRLQSDLRGSEGEMGDSHDDDLARRRIGIEGTVRNILDFQIEREISNDVDAWRDVFVNYHQYAVAEVQAGKFKMPFGLEENTSATNLDFAYRSMASQRLAPGRDRGLMVHGAVMHKVVRYEAGWFAHDGKNARNSNVEEVYGNGTVAARVSVQPFRKHHPLLKDLLVGAAVTGSHVDEGFPGLHAHSALDAPFYTSKVWVNGQRQRTGLEFRWRPGPASLKAEYMRVSTQRLGESLEDDRPRAAHRERLVCERHVGADRREEGRQSRRAAPAAVPRRVGGDRSGGARGRDAFRLARYRDRLDQPARRRRPRQCRPRRHPRRELVPDAATSRCR